MRGKAPPRIYFTLKLSKNREVVFGKRGFYPYKLFFKYKKIEDLLLLIDYNKILSYRNEGKLITNQIYSGAATMTTVFHRDLVIRTILKELNKKLQHDRF